MKITVVNNRATGGNPVPCVDSTSVTPGGEHVMLGRTREELVLQMAQADGNEVIVRGEIEGNDRSPLICVMKNPGDPAGGVDTMAGVGFDLEDEAGAAAGVDPDMYMGVYSDSDCTTPSTTATLDTATIGTIDEGAGTNLIKVTPSSAGVFVCSVDDTADETVYLKAFPADTSYTIDTASTDDVTYTP